VAEMFEIKIKSISRFLPVLLLLFWALPLSASEASKENRVLAVAEKMEAAFKEVKDYTCDIEHIYFTDGVEDQRYCLKFFFKKKKRIRIDFSSPYPELTLCYQENDEKVTLIPLRFLSFVRFHYAINSPKVLTPAGQRIDQTDLGFFIEFLIRSLKTVPQGEEGYREEGGKITFQFQALDYTGGETLEKYQVTVSSGDWLPIRIERRTLKGKSIEISLLQNYRINTHLEDTLFIR